MQFLNILLILASSSSVVLGAPTSDSGVEARAILGFGKSASTLVVQCYQKCGDKYNKCMAEKNPNILKCQRVEATCNKPCADMAMKQDGKARMPRDEDLVAREPVLGFGKTTSTKVVECYQKCGDKYNKCMAEKNPNILKCQRVEATCNKPCADMAVKQDGKARGRREVEEEEEEEDDE